MKGRKRVHASDQWHRFFTDSVGNTREFMYLHAARNKYELEPFIALVKGQGDLYRITRRKNGLYEIWDARP